MEGIDRTSGDTGRVVVVGREGGLRWTYTGHSKINVTTQFDPIDVVTTTMTPTIILLSLVTWIPWGNKDDDTEKNGFISPDFVKSFISELLLTDRSMSLFDVNVMSKI
jgi:hypothetical protein